MTVSRVFTPNRVGNVRIVLTDIVPGLNYDHRWTLEDWDSATMQSLGLKDFTGGAGFKLVLATLKRGGEAGDLITTVNGQLAAEADVGQIRFNITPSKTALLRESGARIGFAGAHWVTSGGELLLLERGRWHLASYPSGF